MAAESPLGSMTDVVNLVIATSPELRARLERMLNLLLDDMELVLRSGYRPHILPLQKAILPGLLRGLQNGQNATQEASERVAFERMMDLMRNGLVVDATATVPV
jgi:hypothetical protein